VTLGGILRERGLPTAETFAINVTLHADDASPDFPDLDSMIRANVLAMYDRMQDGVVIADGSAMLSFVAAGDGIARLTAYRRFMLRARGNVPGDIVYDYEAAHLLHAFIARAAQPTFYDAVDLDGLDDLIGSLIVRWPDDPMLRPADDATLVVIR
jgi:hypothetical protein